MPINTTTMRAYGVPAGGYFENLITANGSKWNRSDKVLDVMTRPYPHIFTNQSRLRRDGYWSDIDSTQDTIMSRYVDVVCGINDINADKQSEVASYRTAMRAKKTKLDNLVASVVDPITQTTRHSLYYLPYHGSDSQNSGVTDQISASWMTSNSKRLKTADGRYVWYDGAAVGQRLWFNMKDPAMAQFWADNAGELLTQGFDGVFADNCAQNENLFIGGNLDGSGLGGNPTSVYSESGVKYTIQPSGSSYTSDSLFLGINDAYGRLLAKDPNCIIVGNGFPWRREHPNTSPYTNRHFSMNEEWRDPWGLGNYGGYTFNNSYWAQTDCELQRALLDSGENCIGMFSVAGRTTNWFPSRFCAAMMFDIALQLNTSISTIANAILEVFPTMGKLGYPMANYQLLSGSNPRDGFCKREFTHAVVYLNNTATNQVINLPENTYLDVFGNPISGSITIYTAGYTDNTSRRAGGLVLKKVNPEPPLGNIPIDPPTSATATLRKDGDNYLVDFTWNDNSSDETGYVIKESTNNITFATVASVGPNIGAYTLNKGLYPTNSTYYYRIYAVGLSNLSSPSNTVNITISDAPSQPYTPLPAPTALQIGSVESGNNRPYKASVDVAWDTSDTATDNIMVPISWTKPSIVPSENPSTDYGVEIAMKLTNISSNHQAYKWEGLWFTVKDRFTNPNRRYTNAPNTNPNHTINWTELMNTAYSRPYELAYRPNGGAMVPYGVSEYPNTGFTGGVKGQEPICTATFRVRYNYITTSGDIQYGLWSNEASTDINPYTLYGITEPPPDDGAVIEGAMSALFSMSHLAQPNLEVYKMGETMHDASTLALNYIFRPNVETTRPDNIYVGLASAEITDDSTLETITEIVDDTYQRVKIAASDNTASSIGAPETLNGSIVCRNTEPISFTFTSPDLTLAYLFITDSASGTSGRVFAYSRLLAPIVTLAGDTVEFGANSITISLD